MCISKWIWHVLDGSSLSCKEEKSDKVHNGVQEANYNHLAEYIDLLYEGMTGKIKGAHYIQFLARDPANLEALAKNGNISITWKK